MKVLTTEEHVCMYWDVIDRHSMETALVVTQDRHRENLDMARAVRQNKRLKAIKEFRGIVADEQKWRRRVQREINRRREADNGKEKTTDH